MSREIEDRLRAAFEARTQQVTTASLRPAAPTDDRDGPRSGGGGGPRRHRWVAPLLAAAAVVAVVVGVTAAVRVSADGKHDRPAVTPTPPTSAPTPAPRSVTPTTPSPSTSSTTNSAPAAGATPSDTGRPATKQISFLGVTLAVPTTWVAAAESNRSVPQWCVQASASAGRCELEVMVVTAAQAADNGFRPDKQEVIGDGNACGSAGAASDSVRTVDAGNAVVGGQSAEYRTYTGRCFPGTWEQWVVPTGPAVIFTRQQADPATEAAARDAVQNAVLPGPRSALRLTDVGILREVDPQPEYTAHIELDRVTVLEQGGISNTNPATYPYELPADLQISAVTGDGTPLTVQQLAQLAHGQTVNGVHPPLTTLRAQVETDGYQVIGLLLMPL